MYYTKAAQEEVLEEYYPVKLFSGSDIISFLRQLGQISDSSVNQDWLFCNRSPQTHKLLYRHE
jgi:hypothetical protein